MKLSHPFLAIVLSAISQVSLAQSPVHFRVQRISNETYESVGVFDVDADGELDLISGGFWYQGPSYLKRFSIREIKRTGEYYDDFMTLPLDVNGDGKLDYITGGWFGGILYWCENPGQSDKLWPEHIIAKPGNIETARAWDIDGDGQVEIVLNNPNQPFRFYRLNRDANGKGNGAFTEHIIYKTQGHGLGFGDINMDGRSDFILANGWLEAPISPLFDKWIWHADFSLGTVSVPILVVDINEDGRNDLIVGQGHDYGLDWYEQLSSGHWKKHAIDPYNSQFHTMAWVDLNGDGHPELLTGKRYRAHNDKDPGSHDDYGLYYYQWTGETFVKQVIAYGSVGVGKGIGNQFVVSDLNNDARPDVAVAGKDGLWVFYNEGVKP